MKKLVIVVVLAAAWAAPCRAAAPDEKLIAAQGIEAAREIGSGVGRNHDPFALRRAQAALAVSGGGGCESGGWRSLDARGEALFEYAELIPAVKDGAAEARSKEFLLEQARFLLGLAGWNAELGAKIAALEKETAAARRAQDALAARAEALKRILLHSGWASPGADGLLHAVIREGEDYAPTTACGGGDYDGPG